MVTVGIDFKSEMRAKIGYYPKQLPNGSWVIIRSVEYKNGLRNAERFNSLEDVDMINKTAKLLDHTRFGIWLKAYMVLLVRREMGC